MANLSDEEVHSSPEESVHAPEDGKFLESLYVYLSSR